MDQMIDHYAQLAAWCEQARAYYADYASIDGISDDPRVSFRRFACIMLNVRDQMAELGRSITVARLESGEIR